MNKTLCINKACRKINDISQNSLFDRNNKAGKGVMNSNS